VEKKRHTAKTLIISTKDRCIHYLSMAWIGKAHDYSILKEEFPPSKNWFKDKHIQVDLGYLGIAKDYLCRQLSIPHKKSKNQALNEVQKTTNTGYARERIFVEHSIGGMKRYRILADRLRNRDITLYNRALETAAGLWNFYLTN
jgi:hypothetical protein